MVDKIEFKELDVEEVPATSSVMLGAAHHLGRMLIIVYSTEPFLICTLLLLL